MATIIGGVFTSHVPAIGGAIARGVQSEPYWKPFFDAFPPIRDWLATARPDVVVTAYNDHGLNFFLDRMPTFAVGAADEYRNADEGWGIPSVPPFAGDAGLSWHLVEQLVAQDFDPVTCQEMLVDHAFTLPTALLWPDQRWPVRVVPVCVNTVQFPLPSAARCLKLGRTLGRAIADWPVDARVLVIGSGGLSHQLDGERAGFINKAFDRRFMQSMVDDPAWATRFSILDLVEQTGTQGVELLNWLVARGMLGDGPVRKVTETYHIPISNTAAGVMLLEPA
jgi:protocatechuate 4,5-dioxygenase beta chain